MDQSIIVQLVGRTIIATQKHGDTAVTEEIGRGTPCPLQLCVSSSEFEHILSSASQSLFRLAEYAIFMPVFEDRVDLSNEMIRGGQGFTIWFFEFRCSYIRSDGRSLTDKHARRWWRISDALWIRIACGECKAR